MVKTKTSWYQENPIKQTRTLPEKSGYLQFSQIHWYETQVLKLVVKFPWRILIHDFNQLKKKLFGGFTCPATRQVKYD